MTGLAPDALRVRALLGVEQYLSFTRLEPRQDLRVDAAQLAKARRYRGFAQRQISVRVDPALVDIVGCARGQIQKALSPAAKA